MITSYEVSNPGKQLVEVGHGSELYHYFSVVPNFIAIVSIWRIEVSAEPYDVDTERLKIVQLRCDTPQIANAVSV